MTADMCPNFPGAGKCDGNTAEWCDTNENMGDKRDFGLKSTIYGQQVMSIDSQGALAALNKRTMDGVPPKPGMLWLGRRHHNRGGSVGDP